MTSEEFVRVRGYLTAQGAKVLPEQLIGSVQEAMTKLREATTAVPPRQRPHLSFAKISSRPPGRCGTGRRLCCSAYVPMV
jgi:hypothetical protein